MSKKNTELSRLKEILSHQNMHLVDAWAEREEFFPSKNFRKKKFTNTFIILEFKNGDFVHLLLTHNSWGTGELEYEYILKNKESKFNLEKAEVDSFCGMENDVFAIIEENKVSFTELAENIFSLKEKSLKP